MVGDGVAAPPAGWASSLGFTSPPPLAGASGGAARDGVLCWRVYLPMTPTGLGASSSSMLGTPPQPTTSLLAVPAACREVAAAVVLAASTSPAAIPASMARPKSVDCHAGFCCCCCGGVDGGGSGGDCRPSAKV